MWRGCFYQVVLFPFAYGLEFLLFGGQGQAREYGQRCLPWGSQSCPRPPGHIFFAGTFALAIGHRHGAIEVGYGEFNQT